MTVPPGQDLKETLAERVGLENADVVPGYDERRHRPRRRAPEGNRPVPEIVLLLGKPGTGDVDLLDGQVLVSRDRDDIGPSRAGC